MDGYRMDLKTLNFHSTIDLAGPKVGSMFFDVILSLITTSSNKRARYYNI